MSANLRQEKIQNTAMTVKDTHKSRQKYFKVRWVLGAMFYCALLLLPFLLGLRPVSEYLGMRAPQNQYSRISFQWKVADKDAIFKEIVDTHYPIYERVPRGAWLAKVFNPVASLLEKAIDLRSPEMLVLYAHKEKIKLTDEEAKTITDYVLKEMNSGLYAEIVSPAMRAIDQWIYSRGLIDEKQYQLEVKNNTKSIEVIDPGNRFASGEIINLQGSDSPVGTKNVHELLERAFYDKLFLLKSSLRRTLTRIIARRIEQNPTLIYEERLTNDILNQRKEIALKKASHIAKGELIVKKGETINPLIFGKLRTENEEYTNTLSVKRRVGEVAGKYNLLLILSLFFIMAMLKNRKGKAVAGIAAASLPLAAIMYVLVFQGISLAVLPVGFLIGFAALGAGTISGLLATGSFCGVAYITCSIQPGTLLGLLISGAVFSILSPKQRFRMGLARCTVFSAVSAAVTFLCWQMGDGQDLIIPENFSSLFTLAGGANLIVQAAWMAFGWGLSFILLVIAMPLLQPVFGVTSNIRLQDLQEHPLLNKLLTNAPSTYYHSSVVSALAETAAQAIDANALLCKTACLYHDIGKLIKPAYFTENESGISRHDSLSPQMSALIIISHVKDGIEMGRQWGLPQAIIDIIEQHHGKTLVSYFLRQAREQAENPEDVDEELFRYPGSKPISREAAVCMIADSVEAASRSLDGASAARIRSLVHAIILGKLEDRQLEESELNFTDLTKIEDALVKILTSMFHSRVKYEKDDKNARRR